MSSSARTRARWLLAGKLVVSFVAAVVFGLIILGAVLQSPVAAFAGGVLVIFVSLGRAALEDYRNATRE